MSFIDCINRGDIDGLASLMDERHTLVVLDEEPLVGRETNIDAWKGYFSAYPNYVIYPQHIAASGPRVAIIGATTGSHLGLDDDEEAKLTVIWTAEVAAGLLLEWRIVGDTPEARTNLGFTR